MRLSLLILAAAALVSCKGSDHRSLASASPHDSAAVGGTLIVSSGADPDILYPPLVEQLVGFQMRDLIFDRLADPGLELNTLGDRGFLPRLAKSWTWAPDSLSIAFHLDPRARWHDGEPVTAKDVKFTFATYRNPAVSAPSAPMLANIDSVTTPDSLTAVYWFTRRYGEQFFDATFQMHIIPEHLLGAIKPDSLRTSTFARQPVGSGRFRFARWEPGTAVELVADTTNYRGRPSLDRVVWTVAHGATIFARVFAGEADVFEALRAPDAPIVARHPELRLVRYSGIQHAFLVFNLFDGASARPHPIFGDPDVRRALSMLIDRKSVVQNVFDSLAVVSLGPFTRAQSSADTTIAQIPFDPEGGKRLLDSLGWKPGANGIRQKGGRPLRFSVLVPTSSANRQQISVLMQEMFKQAGVQMDIEQIEPNAGTARENAHHFDATFRYYGEDPSPATIRQIWSRAAAQAKGGFNIGRYQSATFDALIDSSVFAPSPAASKAILRRAYETIIADVPAIWLYEPAATLVVHTRVRPGPIRADAWWSTLAEWKIDPAQRKSRDRPRLITKR